MQKFYNIGDKKIMALMSKSSPVKEAINEYDCSDMTTIYLTFRDYFINSRNSFGNDINRKYSLVTFADWLDIIKNHKPTKKVYAPETYHYVVASCQLFSKINQVIIKYLSHLGILTKQGKLSYQASEVIDKLTYSYIYDYLVSQKFLYKTSNYAQVIYGLVQTFYRYLRIAKDNHIKANLIGIYFAFYLLDYNTYNRVSILPSGHVLSLSTYVLIILNLFSDTFNTKIITTFNLNAVKTANRLLDLIPLANKVNSKKQESIGLIWLGRSLTNMTIEEEIKKAKILKFTKVILLNILAGNTDKLPDYVTNKQLEEHLRNNHKHTKEISHYLDVSKHRYNKYITNSVNKEIMELLISNLPYSLCLINGLGRHDLTKFNDLIGYFKERFTGISNKPDLRDNIATVALESIGEENDSGMQIGAFLLHIMETFNFYFTETGLVNPNTSKLTKLGREVANTPDSIIDKYTKSINYKPILPYSIAIKRLIKVLKRNENNPDTFLMGLTFAIQLFDDGTNVGLSTVKVNGKPYSFLSLTDTALITLNLFSNIAKRTPIKANDSALDAINGVIKYLPSANNATQQILKMENQEN